MMSGDRLAGNYEFVRISHHWGRSAKVDGARSPPT